MKLHILGICGTFMAGAALLARELGHEVSGTDANVYPPMSDVLAGRGIEVREGFDPAHLDPAPDRVLIGNAMVRGNPMVEAVLDRGLGFVSGPQWVAENVLQGRPVIAVSGTHGKTTTTSLVTWILEQCGLTPGFLIGGLVPALEVPARLGAPDAPFVIEADEYDSALFDKRSKFVHYGPHCHTLVMNRVEFDHADIFDDVAAIRRQFHHLVRTLPSRAHILAVTPDEQIDRILDEGCWSGIERFGETGGHWRVRLESADGQRLSVSHRDTRAELDWKLIGQHNALNAAAAIAAVSRHGIEPARAAGALADFPGVRRRLELRAEARGVRVYDDFAHHPTAIESTLAGLRAHVGAARILAIVDPASNTMRGDAHAGRMGPALAGADVVWINRAEGIGWTLDRRALPSLRGAGDLESIVGECAAEAKSGDVVLVMSNSGFGARIHEPLARALEDRPTG